MGNYSIDAASALQKFSNIQGSFATLIKEMVKNSEEAGASKVEVILHKYGRSAQLIVIDNGNGMTYDQLVNMPSRLGSSVKGSENQGIGLQLWAKFAKKLIFFTSSKSDPGWNKGVHERYNPKTQEFKGEEPPEKFRKYDHGTVIIIDIIMENGKLPEAVKREWKVSKVVDHLSTNLMNLFLPGSTFTCLVRSGPHNDTVSVKLPTEPLYRAKDGDIVREYYPPTGNWKAVRLLCGTRLEPVLTPLHEIVGFEHNVLSRGKVFGIVKAPKVQHETGRTTPMDGPDLQNVRNLVAQDMKEVERRLDEAKNSSHHDLSSKASKLLKGLFKDSSGLDLAGELNKLGSGDNPAKRMEPTSNGGSGDEPGNQRGGGQKKPKGDKKPGGKSGQSHGGPGTTGDGPGYKETGSETTAGNRGRRTIKASGGLPRIEIVNAVLMQDRCGRLFAVSHFSPDDGIVFINSEHENYLQVKKPDGENRARELAYAAMEAAVEIGNHVFRDRPTELRRFMSRAHSTILAQTF